MDSDPGGVGVSGSLERCFVLRWRGVVAVPVQSYLVEPVHPRHGREFEFVDVVPDVVVRPVGALRLVDTVGRLGQGIELS